MEYKSVEELARLAKVDLATAPSPSLTQVERLERWAALLEENPGRQLATFFETEYQTRADRDGLRPAGSPISVAFADPLLRANGLAGDSYGEGKRFFGLTDRQMHNALCYCHFGSTVAAGMVARSVRAAAGVHARPGVFARLRQMFA